MLPKERIDEVLGRVRRCSICQEEWPATREFFYSSGRGGRKLQSMCKACYLERRYPERMFKPRTTPS